MVHAVALRPVKRAPTAASGSTGTRWQRYGGATSTLQNVMQHTLWSTTMAGWKIQPFLCGKPQGNDPLTVDFLHCHVNLYQRVMGISLLMMANGMANDKDILHTVMTMIFDGSQLRIRIMTNNDE